jgi:hypothetical protein
LVFDNSGQIIIAIIVVWFMKRVQQVCSIKGNDGIVSLQFNLSVFTKLNVFFVQ